MGIGIVLLAGHVAIALTGIEFLHFLFIGGTTLLTEAYRPTERAKAQAAHDFLMFGAVGLASFSAGGLLNAWGWQSVNLTGLPFLGVAALAVLALIWHRRQLMASNPI